jgi:hypothetical protein
LITLTAADIAGANAVAGRAILPVLFQMFLLARQRSLAASPIFSSKEDEINPHNRSAATRMLGCALTFVQVPGLR